MANFGALFAQQQQQQASSPANSKSEQRLGLAAFPCFSASLVACNSSSYISARGSRSAHSSLLSRCCCCCLSRLVVLLGTHQHFSLLARIKIVSSPPFVQEAHSNSARQERGRSSNNNNNNNNTHKAKKAKAPIQKHIQVSHLPLTQVFQEKLYTSQQQQQQQQRQQRQHPNAFQRTTRSAKSALHKYCCLVEASVIDPFFIGRGAND